MTKQRIVPGSLCSVVEHEYYSPKQPRCILVFVLSVNYEKPGNNIFFDEVVIFMEGNIRTLSMNETQNSSIFSGGDLHSLKVIL